MPTSPAGPCESSPTRPAGPSPTSPPTPTWSAPTPGRGPSPEPVVRRVGFGTGDEPWQLRACGPVPPAEVLRRCVPGVSSPRVLLVDGLPPPAGPLDLSAVPDGALLSAVRRAPRSSRLEVVVVGGLDAGRGWSLPPGVHTLGSDPRAALRLSGPDVAPRHALVAVGHDDGRALVVPLPGRASPRGEAPTPALRVDGAPATGPVRVRQEVEVGRVRILLRATSCRDEVGAVDAAGGTQPFHRPPPPCLTEPPPPLDLPGRAPAPPDPPTLSLATVAVPLVAGVAVAALVSPRWALFALLGPAVAVGAWAESRWRGRRRHRRALESHATEVARTDGALQVRRRAAEDAQAHRHLAPHELAEVAAGDGRLWSRRAGAPGFGTVRVGIGVGTWDPPVRRPPGGTDAEVDAVVAAATTLRSVPIEVAVRPGSMLGVCGPPDEACAAARAIVLQLAVDSGPADLTIAPAAPPDWRWVRWLPHVAASRASSTLRLAIVDLTTCPSTSSRPETATTTLVVARSRGGLPSGCELILSVGADGSGVVEELAHRRTTTLAQVDGLAADTAARVARRLARWSDPEVVDAAPSLPAAVALPTLVPGLDDPAALVDRWRSDRRHPGLAVPIGRSATGPVVLDLVADGPHVLVAGTTGSGKSELLRTLVLGACASAPPDEVTFLLVDFKGGSAFDPLAELPHVTGVVTDLDAADAARTIGALTAELTRREQLLRTAAAADLDDLRARGGELPRLVVVIDEFASLGAEHPELLDRLVAVAQRGRSLGLHLVLATQHPGTAVRDGIRANVDARIALRLVDTADSLAAIDAPDAAALPRSPRGRALLRTGTDVPVLLQAALATLPSDAAPSVATVTLERERLPGHDDDAGDGTGDSTGDGGSPSDPGPAAASVARCAAVSRGIAAAWREAGGRAAVGPWLPPLPEVLRSDDLGRRAGDDGVARPSPAMGLADRPSELRQPPWVWHPEHGNLAVIGGPGSGVSTTLRSALGHVAASTAPSALHLYAIDRARSLADLAGLPHTGGVAAAHDADALARLLHLLEATLHARRGDQGEQGEPRAHVVVAVDGVAALASTLERIDRGRALDRWMALVTEGPAHGLVWVLGCSRPSELAGPVAARCTRRLVHRLTDPFDAVLLGAPAAQAAALPPGRAIDHEGVVVQVALPPVVPRADGTEIRGGPRPLRSLPRRCAAAALAPAVVDRRGLVLPIGLDRTTGDPALLVIAGGTTSLVAGPAGSGRSTALAVLADRAAAGGVATVALSPRPSPIRESHTLLVGGGVASAAELTAAASQSATPLLVLVDDADTIDVPGALEALVAHPPANVHVVLAGRSDRLRSRYGHWTAAARASQTGLLLRPDPELDGELLLCRLPTSTPARAAARPGDGVLVVDGAAATVLVATVGAP